MHQENSNLKPLISIITVVFNGKSKIEKTIKSIIEQTYKPFEYIIIDGASNDGTLEIIKKYEKDISYWKSEVDKGLYDAMNKGLQAAKGEYVWFINAGDEIYSKDTLKEVMSSSAIPADVYYGETLEVDENRNVIGMRRLKTPEKLNWKSLSMGMLVCHQSIIIKKSIVDNYNLNYKYCADIDWIIRALKKSVSVINTKLIISKFETGGFSRKNTVKGLKERFRIMSHYYGFIPTLFNHFIIGTKFLFFVLLHRRY